MVYTPLNWQAGITPLSEVNMDHLETQYQAVLNLFNAHTILMAILNNTPVPLTMGASTILARLAAGNIVAATPAQLMALLSGSAGAEFLFNTQKIGGVVDPTTNQQAATKKYVDDQVAGAATKEFFVSFSQYHTGGSGEHGDFTSVILNGTDYVFFKPFKCPDDFSALTHCKVIGIKSTNGTIDWTVTTDFAAVGEAYNTHSDSATANGLAMTNTEIEEVDISAAFTGLAADDWVGVKFALDAISAGDFNVIGIVFKYS